jgi:hypothetical protein
MDPIIMRSASNLSAVSRIFSPFLPFKKTSGEVRATRSVTAWGEPGSSASHPYFTDGLLARINSLSFA